MPDEKSRTEVADGAGSPQDRPLKNAPNAQKNPNAGQGKPANQGGNKRPGNQKRPGGPAGPPPVIEIRPVAEPARVKRRHWGLIAGLFLFVFAPLAFVVFYMVTIAEDQYASTTGFTVRQEESGSASDLLGGLASFAGGSSSADADILFEFIQSQEIVQRIDNELDLSGHYSSHWDVDPAFSLWPDAGIEDLVWFWSRVVRVSYNQGTGLIELQVLAFDPDMAQSVSRAIVRESQTMINGLNEVAREDAMRYALADLDEALTRLKDAREALTQFRTRTQIVDPASDIQGRMGVLNNLQQQLAESLIEYDLLQESARGGDPRVTQALRRIQAIRERIAEERQNLTANNDGSTSGGPVDDYPALIAEYESLTVDREFAEETYRAALAALDVARDNASRQSRYLATYISPTRAETAQYPQSILIISLTGLFLFMAWGVVALVYYSLRDRR